MCDILFFITAVFCCLEMITHSVRVRVKHLKQGSLRRSFCWLASQYKKNNIQMCWQALTLTLFLLTDPQDIIRPWMTRGKDFPSYYTSR